MTTQEQTQTQKPKCLGQLKKDCSGNCGFYRECLEISMGSTIKRAVD